MAHELNPRGRQGGGQLAQRREHPLELFRRAFDTFFGPMMGGWFEQDFENMRVWDFEVKEDDKEIAVRAEMPGFDENELDVQIHENVLTIRAQKEQKGEGREEYRSFYRSIALPSGIDAEKVQATYHNGVLEMHIPRTEAARPRRVKIEGHQSAVGPKGQAAPAKGGQPGNGSKSNPAESKSSEKSQK
jgi:HSP20 family protein